MSDLEDKIQELVKYIEEYIENYAVEMYKLKFGEAPKPPPIDSFKASAMAEIARRVRARAVKIEEDWDHFTRS